MPSIRCRGTARSRLLCMHMKIAQLLPSNPLLADLGGVLDFTGELGRLAIAQVGRGGSRGRALQPAR